MDEALDIQYGDFARQLLHWYSLHKRDLPWRRTQDPYLIWISEVILQQTRVKQGYDYYLRFIDAFPDVHALANASEDEVLRVWQGLGYYSRARNLHVAAQQIRDNFEGIFPKTYEDIISLKGVGEYTAAAIASSAYNLPYAVVDGNVYRVLSRFLAIDKPIDSTEGKKLFAKLAQGFLDKKNPNDYNQAIMDFGATQCVPVSPNCRECVLAEKCLALYQNKVSSLPVKQGKTVVKNRYFNYFDIKSDDTRFLHKRTGNDIWKNLYELPLIETSEDLSFQEIQKTESFKNLFLDCGEIVLSSISIQLKHVLSHRIIYARFYKIKVSNDEILSQRFIKVQIAALDKYAISRLVEKYFEQGEQMSLF